MVYKTKVVNNTISIYRNREQANSSALNKLDNTLLRGGMKETAEKWYVIGCSWHNPVTTQDLTERKRSASGHRQN